MFVRREVGPVCDELSVFRFPGSVFCMEPSGGHGVSSVWCLSENRRKTVLDILLVFGFVCYVGVSCHFVWAESCRGLGLGLGLASGPKTSNPTWASSAGIRAGHFANFIFKFCSNSFNLNICEVNYIH